MSDLLTRVLDAHGGTQRWSDVDKVRANFSLTGPFWAIKGWPGGLERVTVEVEARNQHSTLAPFTEPGLRSVFGTAPERLSIETTDGAVVERRQLPRESFAGYTRETPWDRTHLSYFVSYALWNYLTAPFLFTYPGVRTSELGSWREGGQTWHRLQVDFPPSIATHSTPQVFYFDTDYHQRRMDYAPEVTGGSPAAHYTSNYRRFGELLFPTRRLVYIRDPRTNVPVTEQHIIAVDVHNIELT